MTSASDSARLAATIAAALDAIVTIDDEGKILEFNPAAERIFGHARADAVGKMMADLLVPEHLRQRHREAFAEHLRTGRATILGQRIDLTALRADGTEFPVELTITRIDTEDRPLFTGYIRDVTARRSAEQRLDALLRASTVLGSSIDYEETLNNLATLLAETYADICVIDMVQEDGTVHRVAAAHRDASKQELADRTMAFTPQRGTDHVVFRVLDSGQAVVVTEASEDDIRGLDRVEERKEMFREIGTTSYMSVPLVARDRTLGVVSLTSTDPARRYGPAELELVEELIRRAALAIDNARLHGETERAVTLREESLSLLDTLLATAPVGLAFVDHELRYVRINDSLAAMNAATPAAHVGRTVREMVPDLADEVEPMYRRVLETGEPVLDVEVGGSTADRPGVQATWISSYYPVRAGDGEVIGVGAVVVDITERKHIEDELRTVRRELTEQLEDVTRLLQLSGRLTAGLELQSILDEVLASVVSLQGADTGVLRLYEPETDELVIAASLGVGEEYLDVLDRVPARAGVWGKAFAEGRPFVSEDVETDPAFEGFRGAARAGGYRAVYTSPLTTRRGEIIGTIATHFRSPRRPTEREERLLQLYALEASDVIDNARLYRDARETQERLEFLAEASRILSGSLDFHRTLRHVAQLVVPRLADWCSVDVREDDGTIRQVAVAHKDPDKVKWALELQKKYPPDPNAPTGAPNVIRTGQSELLPELPEELIETAVAQDEELRQIIDEIGFYSLMVVPLVARGRTLGAISFITTKESRKRYGARDLAFAEDLARRAGQAVDNARLYTEQRHIARTLQASLLPPELPTLAGVDVAAVYQAAGEGTDVGGDFYDVFETARDEWAVVMGDVCGKGPEAAAVTGLARYTIRAAAMRENAPSSILSILNDAIRRQREDLRFATVAYARMSRRNGHVDVEVACGGHPLPMVLRKDGTVETVGRPGTLLGVFEDAELADDRAVLHPGDAIVLYTDGISQERSPGGALTENELGGRLAATVGMAAGAMAERLVATTAGEDPSETRDDVAVLVVRVDP